MSKRDFIDKLSYGQCDVCEERTATGERLCPHSREFCTCCDSCHTSCKDMAWTMTKLRHEVDKQEQKLKDLEEKYLETIADE